MASILVLGATGYIGGRLIPRLLAHGHAVRCLVRSPEKISGKSWKQVEILKGDVLRPETFLRTFDGIDVIFYLIHSMTGAEKQFERIDKAAAENVAIAAREHGVNELCILADSEQEVKNNLRIYEAGSRSGTFCERPAFR